MTDTTDQRTPDTIARAEYSARLWESKQRETVRRLQEMLMTQQREFIARTDETNEETHRADVAEWECARLRERLATVTAGRVTGVVVDDAMLARADAALPDRIAYKRARLHDVLVAALTSATTVPLASGDVDRWSDDHDFTYPTRAEAAHNETRTATPLYRGLAQSSTTEPT